MTASPELACGNIIGLWFHSALSRSPPTMGTRLFSRYLTAPSLMLKPVSPPTKATTPRRSTRSCNPARKRAGSPPSSTTSTSTGWLRKPPERFLACAQACTARVLASCVPPTPDIVPTTPILMGAAVGVSVPAVRTPPAAPALVETAPAPLGADTAPPLVPAEGTVASPPADSGSGVDGVAAPLSREAAASAIPTDRPPAASANSSAERRLPHAAVKTRRTSTRATLLRRWRIRGLLDTWPTRPPSSWCAKSRDTV